MEGEGTSEVQVDLFVLVWSDVGSEGLEGWREQERPYSCAHVVRDALAYQLDKLSLFLLAFETYLLQGGDDLQPFLVILLVLLEVLLGHERSLIAFESMLVIDNLFFLFVRIRLHAHMVVYISPDYIYCDVYQETLPNLI